MLLDLFNDYRNGVADMPDLLIGAIFTVIVVLLSLSLHECAHGFMAYKLGDPTARNLGRLTLEPTKHLDPIGTLCMLLVGFGWAKPVPVNSRYFKKPRRDMALTAFAGPVANVLLSFIGCLIIHIIASVGNVYSGNSEFVVNLIYFSFMFFSYLHYMNLYLALFNLIPIPPLDGSRIMFLFLPDRLYFGLMKYERYISIAFLVLLYTGILSRPLSFIASYISYGMSMLISFIPGL